MNKAAIPPGVIYQENIPITMRDGVILRANIMRPEAPGHFPAIVCRTPYGKAGLGCGQERFVYSGYVMVQQDLRGRYQSDGVWQSFSVDQTLDGQDGFDTLAWTAEQPWCNGRIGTLGTSYCAWVQWQQARLRPPSLKAMVACSIPTEIYGVDWPGAFRIGRRFHWWLTTMNPDLRRRAGAPPPHTPAEAREIWEEIEKGRLLYLLPPADICNFLEAPLADEAAAWLKNPAKPRWHFNEAHHEIDVPYLDVSGWFDHCNDTIHHLAGMQKNARTALAREQSRLIIGPWNHMGLGKQKQGSMDFGPEAAFDLTGIYLRWFDYWLKDEQNGIPQTPTVQYFMLGTNGKNCWRHTDTWPPKNTRPLKFYLRSNEKDRAVTGSLSTTPETVSQPPDTYRYDPRNPVDTLWSPSFFTEPGDRRKLKHRSDILRYATPPLEDAIEIAGEPVMVLYAASSAIDTDFFVRLIDREPNGRELEICYGFVRARHRHSFEQEDFLTPGEVTEFRLQLGPTACRFAPGHRIQIEITSSDFPNHDRNHNTGGNDLFETELIIADQQIHHTPTFPSQIILPQLT